MPPSRPGEKWQLFEGSWILELDTADTGGKSESEPIKPGEKFEMKPRSVSVFRFKDGGDGKE